MIDLIKLHWQLVKNPSQVIENTISVLPINLGIFVYIFSILSLLHDPNSVRGMNIFFVSIFESFSEYDVILYLVFISAYVILIQYYLMPLILKTLIHEDQRVYFDPDNYRRIIFFSPLSSVIYSIIFIFPIKIIQSYLILDNELNAIIFILIGLNGILSIWAIVPLINIFVIQWKGLKIKYQINNFKIFLMIFIIPIIWAIPFLIIL